jgi:hypothetical protein
MPPGHYSIIEFHHITPLIKQMLEQVVLLALKHGQYHFVHVSFAFLALEGYSKSFWSSLQAIQVAIDRW